MNACLHADLPDIPKIKSGKVRDLFDLGDALLLVATDRISAFDCILPTGIPGKGHIVNQVSAFWFKRTQHLLSNHMLSTDPSDFPASVRENPVLRGRTMLCRKAQPLPIECVVRGYLIGSGWKEYQEKGSVSGVPLRPGYVLADRLDEPVFTPALKAESGHDANITFERMAQLVGADLAKRLRKLSLGLYRHAADYALHRDLLVADTKFEFGLIGDELLLIDELLTPDSSRFWPTATYRTGSSPPSYDKQFVRDYLETLPWEKTPPAPALPDEIVQQTLEYYRAGFRALTGQDPTDLPS